MSTTSNNNNNLPHYNQTTSRPTRGILQNSQDHKVHEAPKRENRLKWDENKLKITEKQKQQVQMKVDEPNTPFIRYDPFTDKVTNWQDLPESIRKAAQEEPEDFSLDDDGEEDTSAVPTTGGGGGGKISFGLPSSSTAPQNKSNSNEWDRVDEQEKRDKEEAARKRHEAFERKRAQHYNEADVFHKNLDLDEEEEDDNDVEK